MWGAIRMTKLYKKEKEGHLQRLPVNHVDQYHVHNEEQDLINQPQPKTHVIIHGSSLEQVPLEMVKKARMVTNPFISKMREYAETSEK